jgi:hypothetical protein
MRRTMNDPPPHFRTCTIPNSSVFLLLIGDLASWLRLEDTVYEAGESLRAGMRHLWAPIAANLAVGVSLGLSLFLYMCERQLEASP